MARAGWTAVEVPFFRGPWLLIPPCGAFRIAAARRQRLENRIQVRHHLRLTSDHLAITALQAPYAAAGSDVHVMNALRAQVLCAADVVDVILVATVDQDVVPRKLRRQPLAGSIHARRPH